MISPELKQKFEEIFVDKFTKDQYEQWKDENTPPTKESKVQKWGWDIFVTIMIAFMISCIGYIFYNETKSRVEQYVYDDYFFTRTYYKGKSTAVWLTKIDQLTDSIKTAQKKAGEDLLIILNK